jgi:ElaA protein
MHIHWLLKKFEELTPYHLYTILQLRNEVFVVEQNCVFQDADDKDQDAHHLMGFNEKKLIAYARLIAPGNIYEQASIGRVVTSPSIRKCGVGQKLMEQSIRACDDLYGTNDIKIGAQVYLKKFYESFGFQQVSDMYMEDGIPHIYMVHKA